MSSQNTQADRCIRCLRALPAQAASCPACQARVVSQMAIGQILVEEGLLRPSQLQEALAEQRATNRRLGTILTERGILSEAEFAATLARQLDIPFFELDAYFVDAAILTLIPEHLCERYRLIPIMKTGEKLVVAFSDPLNQDALADIQMLTGLSIKVVVATPSEVNRALASAFDQLSLKEELTERVLRPPPARPGRPHLRKVR